jgi:hypothetical protein
MAADVSDFPPFTSIFQINPTGGKQQFSYCNLCFFEQQEPSPCLLGSLVIECFVERVLFEVFASCPFSAAWSSDDLGLLFFVIY